MDASAIYVCASSSLHLTWNVSLSLVVSSIMCMMVYTYDHHKFLIDRYNDLT